MKSTTLRVHHSFGFLYLPSLYISFLMPHFMENVVESVLIIKIKLATPFFFWGGGGGGWRQIILQKGGQQMQYCLCSFL